MIENVPGFEYLVNPDRSQQAKIFNGENYRVFNIDEFENKVDAIDWVASSIVKNSINLLTDLLKIGGIQVTFKQAKQTKYFNELLDLGLSENLEKSAKYMKVYGSGYVQLAIEDDLYTRDENLILNTYAPNPNNIFAQYDPLNPQRGASKYSMTAYREVKDKQYILIISFTPGFITYEAFDITDKRNPFEIDVMDIFPEVLGDVDYTRDGLKYVFDTQTDYSVLTHFNNYARPDEFYGESEITTNVISKLNLVDRMYNLADYATTKNAKPTRIYSEASIGVIMQAIDEVMKGQNGLQLGTLRDPESFMQGATTKIPMTRQASMVEQFVDRKLMYSVDNGAGTDRYLVNDYKLDDLFELMDRAKKDIYDDLSISEVFYNPELSTGNVSGIALERLMSRTLEHIKNTRILMTSKIQQLAFTALQLAKESNLDNTTYSMPTDLPDVEWPEITIEDVQTTIARYQTALSIKPLEELKTKAIAKLTHIDEDKINEMQEVVQSQAPSILTEDRANGQTVTNNTNRIRDRIINSVRNGNIRPTDTNTGA